MATTSNFNLEIMGPNCQSITVLKFVKPKYQTEYLMRTIIMKKYIEDEKGNMLR